MNPTFQSSGVLLEGTEYRPIEVNNGEIAGWQMEAHDECRNLLDMLCGLADAPRGAVVWFGRDLATLTQDETLAVLQRIMPLTPDGGLISNVSMAENILLPHIYRNPRLGEQARERLGNLLESEPWKSWFPAERLHELPHKLNPLARALAAILRAWIANPEAVIVCDMHHALEARAADTVSRALAWLRSEMPDAAWIVVQTESSLPVSADGNIMKAQA